MRATPLTAPAPASAADSVTNCAALCQPVTESSARAGVDASLLLGASPSMFTQPLCAVSVLPAMSVDQYVTAWLPSPSTVKGPS